MFNRDDDYMINRYSNIKFLKLKRKCKNMKVVIMYKDRKFHFRYGDVKFIVDECNDTLKLFDLLGAFLITQKMGEPTTKRNGERNTQRKNPC